MKSSLGRAMEQQFGGKELIHHIPPVTIRDFKPKNPYVRIVSPITILSQTVITTDWIATIIVRDKDSGLEKTGEIIVPGDNKKQAAYFMLSCYYRFREGTNSGWDSLWKKYLIRTGQK